MHNKLSDIYDYDQLDRNFKWRFSESDNPLKVELGNDYKFDNKYRLERLEMLDWLIEHNVLISPYDYETYSFKLPNIDIKLEFILRWS